MKEFVVLVSRRTAGSEFQTEGADLEKSILAVMLKPILWDRKTRHSKERGLGAGRMTEATGQCVTF